MDIADLDALLARLREGERRIGVTLVDLDANPTYTMLTAGRLQGETARRIGAALAGAADLWTFYERLRTALDAAEHARGTDKRPGDAVLAELVHLLTGHVVEAPPDPTQPPGGPRPELVDLATAVSRIDRLVGLVGEAVHTVEQVWADSVPRIGAARSGLEPLRARAQALELPAEPVLDSLADLVARTEQRLGDDPLALTPTDLEALDAAASLAHRRIAELEQLRATLDADRARAESLLDALAAKCNAVRAAYAEAVAKVRAPVGVADLSAGDLDTLRALRADAAGALGEHDAPGAHWRTRRTLLDAWLARAAALDARLDAMVEANAAPVRRRDELRGLLGALEAKAAGRQRIERPDTVERLRALHDELGRAPCDLERASSLLDALSRELSTKDA